jgi:hypothetical protein
VAIYEFNKPIAPQLLHLINSIQFEFEFYSFYESFLNFRFFAFYKMGSKARAKWTKMARNRPKGSLLARKKRKKRQTVLTQEIPPQIPGPGKNLSC